MSDTTTVRVGRATRDQLNRVSSESGETVDAVIRRALEIMEIEHRRRVAEQQGRDLANDPADKAEVLAAIREAQGY